MERRAQGNFAPCIKRVDPCSLALPPSRDPNKSPNSSTKTASPTSCSTRNRKTSSVNPKSSRQSGRKRAVTIATNMAGRGTDILLGGNAEFMARLRVRESLMQRIVQPEDGEIAFEKKGNLAKAGANKWAGVKDGLYPCEALR